MNRLMQVIREGLNEGRQKAKSDARLARTRRKHEVKVIVFERTGEVKLATLCGATVCRENLTDYKPCPDELLKCVPVEIANLCRQVAPQYLYLTEGEDGKSVWESTGDPVKI